ncbi:MAG: FAD-binding oxidoreductase [Cytophagales bacterium]|nr:FAD-binding oxidoreductase [Cytophagales bacterium]
MNISVSDLLGLNTFNITGAPIVSNAADIQQRRDAGVNMSIAGMRHSQGGHTALKDGEMLLTETMNTKPRAHGGSPDAAQADAMPPTTVTVDAGMTWAELHFHLGVLRGAPCVHQSSAHFSIGGSISVNCHGRDINFGSIASTVESLEVLAGDGKTYTASRTQNNDLFRAVIGGYGACGVILNATLKVAPNFMMWRTQNMDKQKPLTLDEYEQHLHKVENEKIDYLQMHHGWVNVSADDYLGKVIAYDVLKVDPQMATNQNGSMELGKDNELKHEGWGEGEILRAGWHAMHGDKNIKKQIWEALVRNCSDTKPYSRINFLRESISFTQSKFDGKGVDMLQEYFVPLSSFKLFMERLKTIFPYNDGDGAMADGVQLNSITIRYVRAEDDERAVPYLSYCPKGQSRISVAVDAYVPFGGQHPCPKARDQFIGAMDAAIERGGSYYLPYYSFADQALFERAYTNVAALKSAIGRYNPDHRFSNEFLKQYKIH